MKFLLVCIIAFGSSAIVGGEQTSAWLLGWFGALVSVEIYRKS